jgi:hypothetical protein
LLQFTSGSVNKAIGIYRSRIRLKTSDHSEVKIMFRHVRQFSFIVVGVAASIALSSAGFALGVRAGRMWQAAHDFHQEAASVPPGKLEPVSEPTIITPVAANMQPPPVSEAIALPVLSAEATDLLLAAVADHHGQIYVMESAPPLETKGQRLQQSTLRVRSGEREFYIENTPRIKARWRAAIGELTRLQYVEPAAADGLRATYRVTHFGYSAADQHIAAKATHD